MTSMGRVAGRLRQLLPQYSLGSLLTAVLLLTSITALHYHRKTWEERGSVSLPGAPISRAVFSPKGNLVLSWGVPGETDERCSPGTLLWDAGSGKLLAQINLVGEDLLTVSGDPRGLVSFFPDCQKILIADMFSMPGIWDANLGKSLGPLEGLPEEWAGLAVFSQDGNLMLTCSGTARRRGWDLGRLVRIWNARSLECLMEFEIDEPVFSARISQDGTRAFVTSDSAPRGQMGAGVGRNVRVLDLVARERSVNLTLDSQPLRVDFSPDGECILTAGSPVQVWDAVDGRLLWQVEGHGALGTSAAFSPDGRLIATWGPAPGDGSARVWDRAARERTCEIRSDEWRVEDVRFVLGGDYVATRCVRAGGLPYETRVWSLRDGTCLSTLPDYGEISPDGERIFVCPDPEDVTAVRSLRSGAVLAVLDGRLLAISPQGNRAVTKRPFGQQSWHRSRDERRFGILQMVEFWFAAALAGLLLLSLLRDRKYFKALDAKIAAKQAEASS